MTSEKPKPLDDKTFEALLAEGLELRKKFDRDSRPMRKLTDEDLKFRVR